MVLSGDQIVEKELIKNYVSVDSQKQQAGFDFTLKKIATWESQGVLDFDNKQRELAETKEILFSGDKVSLDKGAYLIEFNETVKLPNNVMATVQTRSSLFRNGCVFTAGVIDPGYEGAVGGLLQVLNSTGITLYKNAKLVQWVFYLLNKPSSKGYSGQYQGSSTII